MPQAAGMSAAVPENVPALVRLTRGLHRPAPTVADLAGRVSAMLSVCPPDTVVAGVTAAQLHGLWLPPWLAEQQRIETIVHRSSGPPARRPGGRRAEFRCRRQTLRTDEVVELDGIPVTSEARTWLDLAARLRAPDLLALGDSALRGSATAGEIDELIRRAWHRPGVVLARRVAPLLNPRSRSRPESHLRWILHEAELPTPQVNEAATSDLGEWLFEPDLSYDDVKLALEYNGADHGEVDRMQRDITRTLDVEQRGAWRVVVFGPREVFQRPDQVARWVAQLRRDRAG